MATAITTHKHPVVDADRSFVIDCTDKKITGDSIVNLSQHSKNSEKITFKLSANTVEGHDMTACNAVMIHFQNTSQDRTERSIGVYKVNDLALVDGHVTMSWLIDEDATRYAGSLMFSIHFSCIAEDGSLVYNLPIKAYSKITVGETVWNSETMANKYPDIIAEFEARIAALERVTLSATAGHVTPEMYGAKGDGVTDDTVAIQAAIDSGLPVVCEPKTYALTGVLISKDTVIDGNGATWLGSGKAYTNKGSCIIQTYRDEAIQCDNIEIRNLKVEATKKVVDMLMVYYTNKLVIDNCVFKGNGWVAGVAVDSGAVNIAEVYYCSNITVENSVFTGASQGKGLELAWCENGSICNNEFSWTGRGGFSLYKYNTNFNVQNNRILHNVKNFSANASDGALDLYGPENNYINITGNYVCGFGSAERNACGSRINGSKHVLFSGNRIETEEDTYCFALLCLHDRTDTSDGTYHENDHILVENNFFVAKEAKVVSYVIRFDNDRVASINVSICNNIIDSDITVNHDISIRRTVQNLTIRGNTLKKLAFHPYLYEELGGYHNIVIEENRCSYIAAYYAENIQVTGNIVEANGTAAPVLLAESSGVLVSGNVVKCPNANEWYSVTNCESVLIATDNIYEITTGKGSTEFDFLSETEGGYDVSVNTSAGKPMFFSVYGTTEKASADTPTIENLVDYSPLNADSSLELIVKQGNAQAATLHDSVIKHGLPVSNSTIANYTDQDGNMWSADYRDWGNGVDVHLVEEKVFDGTEEWTVYEKEGVARRFQYRYKGGKLSVGSVAPYLYGMEPIIANFGRYIGKANGTIAILNAAGSGFELHVPDDLELEAFKAHIAEQYANGTPLKMVYRLAKPYTTPIPAEELAEYENMPSLSGAVNITTNAGDVHIDVTTYMDDKYTSAIDKLIDYKIKKALA